MEIQDLSGRGGILNYETTPLPFPDMACQERENSCVPACVRELLRRQGIIHDESKIIQALGSNPDDRLTIVDSIDTLVQLNHMSRIQFGNFLRFSTEQEAIIAVNHLLHSWIAIVGKPGYRNAHAVIVETLSGIAINTAHLTISDPWSGSLGIGNAVRGIIKWSQFFQSWFVADFRGFFPIQTVE